MNDLVQEGIQKGKRPDISLECVMDAVKSHDQVGGNYEWLNPFYGKVLLVEFREPTKTGPWRMYNRYWWTRHACAISHDPLKLVKEHVKAFVNSKTRKIDLRFWFETKQGQVYSMAPTTHFYELERDYFQKNRLCYET
jgi:hypothetical protein